MKYVILSAFVFLTAMSVVAAIWQPNRGTDKIILTWACDDAPIRHEQIETFNRLHPEYKVQLDPNSGGMEKVIVQSLAGVGPDLFDCYVPIQLMAYVRSGIVYDLTDEFAKRGMSLDEFWPCSYPTFVFQGRVYGHPGNANAPGIWYNKALFDKAGVPYPNPDWTWEEFIETARKLTVFDAANKPVHFGFLGPFDGALWDSLLREYGASYFTPEGTRCTLDSPKAIAAMQFLCDLIYKYKVMQTPAEEAAMAAAGGWSPAVVNLFGAGKGAMASGGRWWLVLLRDPSYAHLKLGAAPLPKGPTGNIVGGGRSTLVNKKTKHLEGCLKFIEYLHSKESNDIVNRYADALPPVKEYCYTPEFVYNDKHPDEDFHEMWRIAAEPAGAVDLSPFVNGSLVNQIMLVQTDLLKYGRKSAAEAMADATEKINKAIVDELKNDPKLHEEYYALIKQGAQPAWDRPEDAP